VNEDNDRLDDGRNEEKIVNFEGIRCHIARGRLISGLKGGRLHPRYGA